MTDIVAYQSTQTGTDSDGTVTMNKPASLASGELLLCGVLAEGTPTWNTPTGWTKLGEQSGGNIVTAVFYKVADANDAAATDFTFTASGGANVRGSLSRYTGQNTTTAVDQYARSAGTNAGITPTLGNGQLVVFSFFNDADGTPASVSSVSIATDDITWTSRNSYGNSNFTIAIHSGSRSPITATGNVTVTPDDTLAAQHTHILNIPLPELSLFSSSFSVAVPTMPSVLDAPLSGAFTLLEPTATTITPDWLNLDKSSTASFTNATKS